MQWWISWGTWVHFCFISSKKLTFKTSSTVFKKIYSNVRMHSYWDYHRFLNGNDKCSLLSCHKKHKLSSNFSPRSDEIDIYAIRNLSMVWKITTNLQDKKSIVQFIRCIIFHVHRITEKSRCDSWNMCPLLHLYAADHKSCALHRTPLILNDASALEFVVMWHSTLCFYYFIRFLDQRSSFAPFASSSLKSAPLT